MWSHSVASRTRVLCLAVLIACFTSFGRAQADVSVSCDLSPVASTSGADLGGRWRYSVRTPDRPLVQVESVLLVLDRKAEVIREIAVADGELFQFHLRDTVIIHPMQNEVSWLVHAPGLLFRASAKEGFESSEAYCSPYAAIRADRPANGTFVANSAQPRAPVHLVVAVTQMLPESVDVQVDCVDVLEAVGATLPGGPFDGIAEIAGEDITIEDLIFDPERGVLSFTLLDMPGGGHKVSVKGHPNYAPDLPRGSLMWQRPLGALENERTISVFRVKITDPSDASNLPFVPVPVGGVITHGAPFTGLRVHGQDVAVVPEVISAGDECIGDTYSAGFELTLPTADLARDFAQGDDETSALDPGVNFVSAVAVDGAGNASGDRIRITLGDTVGPNGSIRLPYSSPSSVPGQEPALCPPVEAPQGYAQDGFAASVSSRAMTEAIRFLGLTQLRMRALGLKRLEGQELSKLLAVDPCEGEPLPSTHPLSPVPLGDAPSASTDFSNSLDLLGEEVGPELLIGPLLDIVGDRSVLKTKMMQLNVTARVDQYCPISTREIGILNPPLNSSLDPSYHHTTDQCTRRFGWVPHCDQVGTYPVTFYAEDCRGRTEQTVILTVEDGKTDVELDMDLKFERVSFDVSAMDLQVDIVAHGNEESVEVAFDSGLMEFDIDAHKCLAHWGFCWLSVHVPVSIDVNNLRILADLTPEQALCGFDGTAPSFSVDEDHTDIDVTVGTPDFGGFFGWLVDFLTLPLRVWFTVGANLYTTFMNEYFIDLIEDQLADLFLWQYPDGKIFSIPQLKFSTSLSASIPLSLSLLSSQKPILQEAQGTGLGSLSLGLHSRFHPLQGGDPESPWVATWSPFSSATEEMADIVLQASDDAVNQLLSALSSTGTLRGSFTGFTAGDFLAGLPPEVIVQLQTMGVTNSTPVFLTLDLAQDPHGNNIPPLIGLVDQPGSPGLEVIVRVQVLVRGIIDKGLSITDDRALCSCTDLRPECQAAPCMLFEDVLKLNLMARIVLVDLGSGSVALDFEVTDIQQLARGEGFTAFEAVNLSTQEDEIVATTADSPLLAALMAELNASVPCLTVPDEALTLNGTVVPRNLRLFSATITGSGWGTDDYVGLSADVEVVPR